MEDNQKEQLKVIYEDNHLLVVIKPQNVPSQEDSSGDLDMLTMCKSYIKETKQKEGNVFCGLVHRLDRPTGGIMVFAKTSKCASRLAEQMKSGAFKKTYLAALVGAPKKTEDRLENYLLKNTKTNVVECVPQATEGAKLAQLDYEIVERGKLVSLAKINLITGRSHQVRVQFSFINCPVFGDAKYGGDKLAKGHNLALWAYMLEIDHPTEDKRLKFVVNPPIEAEPWKRFNYLDQRM